MGAASEHLLHRRVRLLEAWRRPAADDPVDDVPEREGSGHLRGKADGVATGVAGVQARDSPPTLTPRRRQPVAFVARTLSARRSPATTSWPSRAAMSMCG